MANSDIHAVAKELSEIERKALSALAENKDFLSEEEISAKAGINIDSARRAAAWLAEKKLAEIKEEKKSGLILTALGKEALVKGLPEKRMLQALSKKNSASFSEIMKSASLNQAEFNSALGQNRKKAFVSVSKKGAESAIELTNVGKEFLNKEMPEEKMLKKISEKKALSAEEHGIHSELVKRNLLQQQEESRRKFKANESGLKALDALKKSGEKREFVLDAEVRPFFIGKKQPYVQFLNSIRRKLTELGFKEMDSPLVVQEFYNFDVLFQPQNHPARTWSDTYQLLKPKTGKLPHKKIVEAVKAAHETGGVSASSGWRYSWLEEIAERMMPAAHGTAHSARQLIKGVEVPGKYFAIARCFRPDVMDATHLIEFNQTEGFIVGENLNFRHLLGTLEQFAKEIAGAKEVRFYPDYYPFTEPSVQISAKHPQLGWIELGGAGMFRPEMLENLGIKGQAIAWGIGIDRLAMFKLGIKDIRNLFSDDLGWLRNSRMVVD